MSFRLVFFSFALAFGSAAGADSLQPIQIRVPTSPSTIHKKCGEAFEQLKKDRKQVEARENFSCFAILPRKDVNGIEAGFMILCERAVSGYVEGAISGVVTVDVDVLKTAFNTEYRPLIASSCASREALKISNYNSSRGNYNGGSSGYGQGMREGCFATHSCY